MLNPAQAQESWYVVLLDGQRAGHVHQTQKEHGNQITTTTAMRISVGRGTAVIHLDMDSRFTETADGNPVQAESSLNMGGTPIQTAMKFTPGGIDVTTTQGDHVSTAHHPRLPVEWMPPAAMARHVEQQLAAEAETIVVTTMDPAMGLTPFTTTMKIMGEENIEVFGRTVPAKVWEATVSNLPGVTMREYVDATGRSLKSTVQIMTGLELTVVEADKDLALSPMEPPELMVETLIKPTPEGVKIKRPRTLQKASYRVTGPPAQYAWPTTAAQSVGLLADPVLPPMHGPAWRINVNANNEKLLHLHQEPLTEAQRNAALESSLVLNHEDPAVTALRDEALADLPDAAPADVAEHLRCFVHDTIAEKNLSVGFATASEVARTKQGDCTEHAVLLAALLRGAGIPSRGVSGLVYADQFLGKRGVFGYHMWTQAWLDPDGDAGPASPRWVDLDATLDAHTPFDATHIALSTTDLNGTSIANDMVQLAPLLGNLSIEVLEAE